MKYYSEEETEEQRLAFENIVLDWARVTKKKMFGCPCYKVDERLFAFIVTKGVVITKLAEKEKEAITNQFQTTPFQTGKKVVQNWVRIPIENKSDIDKVIPFVRKSYNNAVQRTKET